VSRQYHFNYVTAFRKAALIFVTHSTWGGWHHVEVHDEEWWIRKFESYGFKYDDKLSKQVRQWAYDERFDDTLPKAPVPHPGAGENGWRAVHLIMTMKVFINPAVASLPEHAHLFAGDGCFDRSDPEGKIINRPCGTGNGGDTETTLSDSFQPLKVEKGGPMHRAWHEAIVKGLNLDKEI